MKEKILEAWIMVEHLSEGSIKLGKDHLKLDAIKNDDYYSLINQILREKNVGKKGGVAFYFDIFDFEEVVSLLRKKYNLKASEEETDKSQKFSFVLCFDKEMNFLQDMTFFTESAYVRYFQKIPKESDFREFEENFKEDLVRDFDETEDKPDKFNDAIRKVMKKYNVTNDNCRIEVIKNTETGTDNLHSFFIDDLEKAKYISTPNFDAYLFGNSNGRVNLDSKKNSPNFNPSAFQEILQPINYPLGRFPSNTKFSLSLMQQVAVNLSTGYDNSQIRSVNGPPGTGKTTLLKDIFAQLVVQQAADICSLTERCIKGTDETVYFKNASIGILPDNIAENNIVVASSNNGAVQNIVNELPLIKGQIDDNLVEELKNADYFLNISNSNITPEWKEENGKKKKELKIEPCGEEKFWGLFSLEGGKSDNMNNIINNLECVVKYFNDELDEKYVPDPDVYDEFIEQYTELNKCRKAMQKKSEKLQTYQKKLKELNNLNDNFPTEFENKKAALNNQVNDIKNEIAEIDAQIKQLQSELNECAVQKEKIGSERNDAELYFNSVKAQKPGIFAKRTQKDEYNKKMGEASQRINDVITQAKELNARENNITAQIKQLQIKSEQQKNKSNQIVSDFNKWVSSVKSKIESLESQTQKTAGEFKDINALDMEMDYDELHLSRQHRIIIVVRLRSQIFRQIVQIERRRAGARQAKFVQDDGKYASKRMTKALAVNCAVLPQILGSAKITE